MRQEDRVLSSILTRIGDALRLNSDKQTIIESRMFSKGEVKVLCTHGLRNYEVQNIENYKSDVLNSYDHKFVSIANDEIIGCLNATDTTGYRAVFH